MSRKDTTVRHQSLQGVNSVAAGAGGKNLTNVENSTPVTKLAERG